MALLVTASTRGELLDPAAMRESLAPRASQTGGRKRCATASALIRRGQGSQIPSAS
jgi:hypothetical protein